MKDKYLCYAIRRFDQARNSKISHVVSSGFALNTTRAEKKKKEKQKRIDNWIPARINLRVSRVPVVSQARALCLQFISGDCYIKCANVLL